MRLVICLQDWLLENDGPPWSGVVRGSPWCRSVQRTTRGRVWKVLSRQSPKVFFILLKDIDPPPSLSSGIHASCIYPRLPTTKHLIGFMESTKDFKLQKPGQPFF